MGETTGWGSLAAEIHTVRTGLTDAAEDALRKESTCENSRRREH